MIGLLARLAPTTLITVAMAAAALPAGAAGWLARGYMADTFERPAIIRTQEQIWTAELEAAVNKARADEQLRQFRIGEAATEQFLQSSERAADDRQAVLDLLQLETERYAATLAEEDRVCGLTADDLEFLGVRQHQGAAAPGGGR